MIIQLSDVHTLVITENPDGSCVVDFIEAGLRLGSELWRSLPEVIEEYC